MSDEAQEERQETLGEAIDKLDVTTKHLDEGDLITDVVVLYRYSRLDDGKQGMGLTFNRGQDALLRIGMLKVALAKELFDFNHGWEDEEEG